MEDDLHPQHPPLTARKEGVEQQKAVFRELPACTQPMKNAKEIYAFLGEGNLHRVELRVQH